MNPVTLFLNDHNKQLKDDVQIVLIEGHQFYEVFFQEFSVGLFSSLTDTINFLEEKNLIVDQEVSI